MLKSLVSLADFVEFVSKDHQIQLSPLQVHDSDKSKEQTTRKNGEAQMRHLTRDELMQHPE
jgi:hypothetical protein